MADGKELTKEQLLEYVKKQRIKIRKLETELESTKGGEQTADGGMNDSTISESGRKGHSEEEHDLKTREIESLKSKYGELQLSIKNVLGGYISVNDLPVEEISTDHIRMLDSYLARQNQHINYLTETIYDLQQKSPEKSQNQELITLSEEVNLLKNREIALLEKIDSADNDYKELESKYESMIQLLQTENEALEGRLNDLTSELTDVRTRLDASLLTQIQTREEKGFEEKPEGKIVGEGSSEGLELVEGLRCDLVKRDIQLRLRESLLEATQAEVLQLAEECRVVREREQRAQQQLAEIETSFAQQAIEQDRVYKVMEKGYTAMQERHDELTALVTRLVQESDHKSSEISSLRSKLGSYAESTSQADIQAIVEKIVTAATQSAAATSETDTLPVSSSHTTHDQNGVLGVGDATILTNAEDPSRSASEQRRAEVESLKRLVGEQADLLQEEQQRTTEQLEEVLHNREAATAARVGNLQRELDDATSRSEELLAELNLATSTYQTILQEKDQLEAALSNLKLELQQAVALAEEWRSKHDTVTQRFETYKARSSKLKKGKASKSSVAVTAAEGEEEGLAGETNDNGAQPEAPSAATSTSDDQPVDASGADFKAKLETAETEVAGLREELRASAHDYQQQIERQQSALQAALVERTELTAAFCLEKKSLEDAFEARERDIDRHIHSIAQLNQDIASLQLQVQSLQVELQSAKESVKVLPEPVTTTDGGTGEGAGGSAEDMISVSSTVYQSLQFKLQSYEVQVEELTSILAKSRAAVSPVPDLLPPSTTESDAQITIQDGPVGASGSALEGGGAEAVVSIKLEEELAELRGTLQAFGASELAAQAVIEDLTLKLKSSEARIEELTELLARSRYSVSPEPHLVLPNPSLHFVPIAVPASDAAEGVAGHAGAVGEAATVLLALENIDGVGTAGSRSGYPIEETSAHAESGGQGGEGPPVVARGEADANVGHQDSSSVLPLAEDTQGASDAVVTSLRDTIDALQASLAERDGVISRLTADLAAVEQQVTALRVELEGKEEELVTVRSETVTKAEEISTLTAAVKTKDEEIATLKSKLQKLSSLSKSKKKEQEGLNQQLEKTKQGEEELRAQVTAAESALEEAQQAIEAKAREIDELKTRNQFVLEQMEAVTEQSTSLQSELSSAKEEVEQLKGNVATLESRVQRSTKTHNEMKEKATKKLAEVQAELETTKGREAESAAREQSLSEQLASVQAQLTQTEASEKKRGLLLKELQKKYEALREELGNSRREGEDLGAQLTAVQAELVEARGQLSTAQTEIEDWRAQVAAKDEELSANKVKIMKYNALVKTKTKELEAVQEQLADTQTDLEEVRVKLQQEGESAAQSIGQLQAHIESLEATTQSLTQEKEVNLKKIEKLTQMVKLARREKDTASSSSSEQLLQVTAEAEEAKRDCEQLRVKVNQLEETIQQLEGSSQKERQDFEGKLKRLNERNKQLTSRLSSKEKDANDAENSRIEELTIQLSQSEDRIKVLEAEKDNLQRKLAAQKKECDEQLEAMSEKVKRMKTLLSKSRTVALEKDVEIQKLKASSVDIRAPVFSVTARLSISSLPTSKSATSLSGVGSGSGSGSGKEARQVWCLLSQPPVDSELDLEDGDVAADQLRWVPETTVQQWIEDGSSMLGDWPEPLNEMWRRSVADAQSRGEKECEGLRSRMTELAKETETAKKELADVTFQFQTYKNKAQLALRRVGAEDHGDRIRLQLEESVRIKELEDLLAEQEQRLLDLNNDYRKLQLDQEEGSSLRQEAENLRNSLAAAEAKLVEEARRYGELRDRYEETRASRDMEEDRRQLAEAAAAGYRAELDRLQSLVASGDIRLSGKEREAREDAVDGGLSIGGTPKTSRKQMDFTTPQPPVGSGMTRQEEWTPSGMVASVSKQNTSNSLLLQETERALKDSIAELRTENTALLEEKTSLARTLQLSEEQTSILKESIRELEAALCREKEFNAESSRLNAEYLVNVLRKFFMASDPNEKANLVPVICSILHFRSEEAKLISARWAVQKTKRGIAGWFGGGPSPSPTANSTTSVIDDDLDSQSSSSNTKASAAATASATSAANSAPPANAPERPSLDAYKDGIGGLDIY